MANRETIKMRIVKEEQPIKSIETGLWLKIAKVCLYLLIFLIPLFFLPWTVAPVEINKQLLAAVLLFIAFAFYLIDSLENKRIIYPKSLLALAVLILLATTGLSAIFSKNLQFSLWGNSVQPDSLINFALYGLAFYLGAVLLKQQQIKTAGLFLLAGLALTVIFGLLQIFRGFILPWDFSRQPNFNTVGNLSDWGIFISFGLVMIISLLTDKTDKLSWIYPLGVLGLLIAAGLIVLNNKTLWLSLALTMVTLAIYKFIIKPKPSKPGLSLIILIIVMFFFLIGESLPALINLPIEARPTFLSTFQIAKEVISGKRIVFGSGPATFGYDWSLFKPVEINQTDFWQVRFNQGFSFAITALATIGVFGVLAILFLIFSLVKTTVSHLAEQKDEQGIDLTAIIFSGTTFLIISWFLQPAFFTQMIFAFLSLGFIVSLSPSQQKEISLENLSRRKSFISFVALIVLLIAGLVLFSLIGKKYAAAVYYGEGVRAFQNGNLTESLFNLEKAARLDRQNDQYRRILSQALLSQAGELIRQNPNANFQDENGLQIINVLSAAVQSARSATENNPVDSFNWSNLGNIYENLIPLTGEADKFAVESYRRATELDPKNPQEMVNLARALFASAQKSNSLQPGSSDDKIKEAKQTLEKSLGLMPNYQPAVSLMNQIKQAENIKQ